MYNPTEIYVSRISILRKELEQLNHLKRSFGWLRFLSMALSIASTWWLIANGILILLVASLAFLILFFYFLKKDLNNKAAIENIERLLAINETEIQILQHQFTHLPDGREFKTDTHDYANDLDIFGRSSIYQYINRTTSEQGNRLYADWLLSPASHDKIIRSQEAIKELQEQYAWRQQLQSYGIANPINISTQQKINYWVNQKNISTTKTLWQVLRFLLPAVSCSFVILHLSGLMAANTFYLLLLVMIAVSFSVSKKVLKTYTELNKITSQLETLSESINWIEKKEFNSTQLQDLKKKFDNGNMLSSKVIKELKKILDRLDIRLNPLVFIPLNTLFFWDLQQLFALEKWKNNNKERIDDWFNALASFESYSSVANFAFNHPQAIFPELSGKDGVFIAEELGHPLIPKEKLVLNDFATEGTGILNLITGSNMAGKSTFLRSVGVNIVLAMMGSPVIAKSLTLSYMKAMSSMRVSDNLEESTSTFYAELKKLKEVIDAVYKNEKVFLLLDEILRGTNSADRHIGSKALIRQLIQHNGYGLIATHDLELAKPTDDYAPQIHNYHFDVQVSNDELHFDYKLNRGVCRSMNASVLMKKIGIEL